MSLLTPFLILENHVSKPAPEYVSIRPVDTTLSLSTAETQSVEIKPQDPIAESKWGIGWRTVSSMVFFFVLGKSDSGPRLHYTYLYPRHLLSPSIYRCSVDR